MSLERATRSSIPAGEAVILQPRAAPWSLSVAPGDGGTASVEVTLSSLTAVSEAVWHALDAAPLTAARLYLFPSPVVAVRISAADADAQAELMT